MRASPGCTVKLGYYDKQSATASELFQEADDTFLPAQRHASAVLAVVVCPSVCLSQAGTVPKRLNAGSRKQRRTIAQQP